MRSRQIAFFLAVCLLGPGLLPSGEKALQQLAIKQFAIPGDTNWALGSMYPAPRSAAEGEGCKAYFKQCREEVLPLPGWNKHRHANLWVSPRFRALRPAQLGRRLVQVLFLPEGGKNKWWLAFSKRKFMGKELRDR